MRFSLVLLSTLGLLTQCHADAVRLQINGPDGKPVVGAKVRITESTGFWFRRKPVATADLTSDNIGVVTYESKNPLAKTKTKLPTTPESQVAVFANVRSAGLAVGTAYLKAGDNTLALQTAQPFEGVALDENQKPVAGARLVVSFVRAKGKDSASTSEPGLEATTDANGRYRFEALPREGKVTIEVDDPAWKRETFTLDLAQKAVPLFLERGITIKGRMLKPDGSPAANVRFYAGDHGHQPTTRADGTFEATGLSVADVYLQLTDREQKLPFVVPNKAVNDLKPGEVRDIGDWKTQSGVRARGRIVATDTKKPIANAYVSLWGGGDGEGQTNPQGAFDFLVEPGASVMTVRAEGFVALLKSGISDAKDGVVEIGTLELKRGKRVSGVALDEKGNPLINLSLRAHKKNGNTGDQWAQIGPDGRFSFDGLDAGEYTVRGDGLKITEGAKFSVGTGATPLPSLRIKATGAAVAAPQTQTVSGRVETPDGTAVAGAKIALRLGTPGGSYQSQNALSLTDGTFSTNFTLPGNQLKVLEVNRPGFVNGKNHITSENGNWKVRVTLQPKGAALRGRVVNAVGQGVARAFVALRDSYALPIATDENGNFALEDAPLQDVTLLASDGNSLASFEVKGAGQKVEIALPTAPPIEDKTALANSILQNAQLGWSWKGAWDTLGSKRMGEVILGAGVGDANGNKQWAWSQYLDELAHREPKEFLSRESELRAATESEFHPIFERLLMLSKATAGDEAQKAQVSAWLSEQEKAKRNLSSQSVEELLKLAEVGARLDPKSGAMWLEYAGQIADQIPDNGGRDSWQWGALVARVQKDAPLSFGDDWKPTAQLMLLNSAMTHYRETGDVENARRAREKSQLVGQKAAQNPDADLKPREYGPRPSDLVKQTTNSYAGTLARTDPRAALALAPELGPYEQAQLLNTIARSAAKLKQFDVAKQAIGTAFDVPLGNVEFVAEAARIAQEFDATFAAPLWPRAYAKARPRSEDEGRSWHHSLAAYAGARAPWFAGESRITIEREWQRRIEEARKPKSTDEEERGFDEGGSTLGALAEAMAKVSPTRALEMLDSVPERENRRAQTRLNIALSLLKPEHPPE